jgi:hypothetical protein
VASSPWWAAARSGFSAALAGIAAAVVVVVVCWLPDAGVSGHPMSAIKAGLLSFLAGQGGGITVDGVSAGFLPLGVMLVLVLIAGRAGATLAEVVREHRLQGSVVTRALALQTATYTAVCIVLVPLSRLGTSHAPLLGVTVGALLLFGSVSAVSLYARTGQLDAALARLPAVVTAGLRSARAVVVVYLAAGTLLALGSVLLHAGRVMELSRQVGGGLSGFPILVAGVFSVPNAVIAGSSYLAGPGFSVGAGSSINAFSTTHGLLPAFPLLGAVPDGHGANPIVLALMALTPMVAGVAAAVLVRREGATSIVDGALAVAVAALASGSAMAILAGLGGGPAGSGRLRVVGASPWQMFVFVVAAVLLVGLLGVLARALWDRFAPAPSAGAELASAD